MKFKIGLLLIVAGVDARSAAFGDCPGSPAPEVHIRSNGLVFTNPAYPYIGNKYHYEIIPGDSDLPALRAYAAEHGVFDGVNMSLDWKEREWEMILAIIHHTSHLMHWTGSSTVNHFARALPTLNDAHNHPNYTFSCGAIAACALGLAHPADS